MHVWGEGGRPHHPVGGNAVGRGVEPTERDTKLLVTTTRSHPLWVYKGFCRISSTDPFCKAVVGS